MKVRDDSRLWLLAVACGIAIFGIVEMLNAGQVMPADLRQAYLNALPDYDDPRIEEFWSSEDTILYTNREMPKYHQNDGGPGGGGLVGVFRANQQVAAFPDGTSSNSDLEFPWKEAGGVHSSARNVQTVKAFRLPRVNGKLLPVVYFRMNNVLNWTFPKGTQFAEVQWIVRDGKWYPYETRFREIEEDAHDVDVFRPFPTRDDLVARLRELGHDGLADTVIAGVRQRRRIRSQHPTPAFDRTAVQQILPDFPEQLTKELLVKTKHVSAVGQSWSDDADGPTTERDFHIVSKRFFGSHVGNDRDQCNSCHNTALVRNRFWNARREWYGLTRGGSGILSWHPFSPQQQNALRGSWVRDGTVARFDSRIHSRSHYTQNRFQMDELSKSRTVPTHFRIQ